MAKIGNVDDPNYTSKIGNVDDPNYTSNIKDGNIPDPNRVGLSSLAPQESSEDLLARARKHVTEESKLTNKMVNAAFDDMFKDMKDDGKLDELAKMPFTKIVDGVVVPDVPDDVVPPWFAEGGWEDEMIRFDTVWEEGGSSVVCLPLEIVRSKPSYIPPAADVVSTKERFYVTWGTVSNTVSDNWDDNFDILKHFDGVTHTTYFFVKATLSTGTTALKVASFEVLTGAAWNTHETPDWAAGGVRPSYYVFSIGAVHSTTPTVTVEVPEPFTTFTITPNAGSVLITEHLSNITGTGVAGDVNLTKQLSHYKV